MPTVQQLLLDVNLRYRNTFTDAQKVTWMNYIQRQIFQTVRHEAAPFDFTLVSGQAYYPLPSDCDVKGIELVTLQVDSDTGTSADYEQLDYRRKEELSNKEDKFYSIANGNIYINPLPNTTTAGRKVYIYYTKRPAALSDANLSAVPDLEEDFHELLAYGVLEKIAEARKDVAMKNNFATSFAELFANYDEQYSMTDPEFVQPIDVLPRASRSSAQNGNPVSVTISADADGGVF